MFFSKCSAKLRVGFLALSLISAATQAFGADLKLHCDGYHPLDAVILSGTRLGSVTLATTDARNDISNGQRYPHFNTEKVFRAPVDDDNVGVVPSGEVLIFDIGDEKSWGYALVVQPGFDKKKSFSASLADWEPADTDEISYHDMDCTVLHGGE